jgi:BCD family chlorophyll transporter-like MFS transporter
MGLWGAAQAIGFAVGGLLGTLASDLARWLIGSQVAAYGAVFAAEALLFVVAAGLAAHITMPDSIDGTAATDTPGDVHERIAHL